ncbi:hypothetical protein AVEN_177967-1 [Araneus ventricosus]|uniref:Histone-lysine N-methyltransferase SETMAR n=1 Tax=Araneus ventricosus TaxID=182803 RepID=A0A4Y2JSV4_ARAVE|nr:hypothetical protein AVEN_177967-1 [Araneus ventricosus]
MEMLLLIGDITWFLPIFSDNEEPLYLRRPNAIHKESSGLLQHGVETSEGNSTETSRAIRGIVFHHNTARPHAARLTEEKIDEFRWQLLQNSEELA